MKHLTFLGVLMVSYISTSIAGDWCHLPRKAAWGYDRNSGKPVFKTVEEAKAACEASEECGGVGLDRVPYTVGGVTYTPTIYLLSVKDAARDPYNNYRYDTYLKGACQEN